MDVVPHLTPASPLGLGPWRRDKLWHMALSREVEALDARQELSHEPLAARQVRALAFVEVLGVSVGHAEPEAVALDLREDGDPGRQALSRVLASTPSK